MSFDTNKLISQGTLYRKFKEIIPFFINCMYSGSSEIFSYLCNTTHKYSGSTAHKRLWLYIFVYNNAIYRLCIYILYKLL